MRRYLEFMGEPLALEFDAVKRRPALKDPATAMAVVQGGTAIMGAMAERSAAKFNATVAEQNAASARQVSAAEAQRQRISAFKQIGQAKANAGATGIATDSFADIMEESELNAELDNLLIKHQGAQQARGYEITASLERARGKNAMVSGLLNAGSAAAGGYSKAQRTG